jgi:uncharacterized damage-inducible protein DinB
MKAHTLSRQLDLHTPFFNKLLFCIDDTEADQRASRTVNHIKWLAGHLLSTRYSFKELAGLDVEDPYADLFAHGKSIDDQATYPPLSDIRERWNAISGKVSEAFVNLPSEIADGPSPVNVPVGDMTLGGFLSFLMHHEAYHLGQMGILRKYLGKEGMDYA